MLRRFDVRRGRRRAAALGLAAIVAAGIGAASFQPLRIKIHGSPDAGDADTVRA